MILKAVVLCLCVAPSTTMQYIILTYMKHLGVRCKEPRSLESKRVRINFLPKIKVLVWTTVVILARTGTKAGRATRVEPRWRPGCSPPLGAILVHRPHPPIHSLLSSSNHVQKSIKTEKDGEEKVKKPRFPSILGPQRRPSRVEAASGEPSRT